MVLDLNKTRQAVKLIIATGEAESQRDLADKLGYTESAFSQVLKSKTKLSGRFVRNLYNFTQKQFIRDLLDGKDIATDEALENETQQELPLNDVCTNEFLIKRIEALENEINNQKQLYLEILRNNTELTTVNVELIKLLKDRKND